MKKLIVVLSLFCMACAGTPIEWGKVRQVKAGMSYAEVEKLMGTPYSTTTAGDRTRYIWVWVNLYAGSKSVSLDFIDNKLVAAPTVPSSF